MPIPAEHQFRFAYHFTHLENLPGILEHGFLCYRSQEKRGLKHESIAASGIQLRRSKMRVTCGPGGVVHDYVPFYFCKRSKMLLSVVNTKNVDQQALIYLVVPIEFVESESTVFTDASANTEVPPNFYQGGANLSQLNWKAIDSKKWSLGSDIEEQQRMAEMLVHECVDLSTVTEIIAWNSSIKGIVEKMFKDAGKECPGVTLDPHHYFSKWPTDPSSSLVTGPIFTHREFRETVDCVKKKGHKASAPHKNVAALLSALRKDFCCIRETAEIDGLETDNEVHSENVGDHTRMVVKNLRGSAVFQALDEGEQRITELAAYLHDIGKGPKQRWAKNRGKQRPDPDHPIESVKMLRRILTDEIREIKPRTVRVLSMLVCYHDLLGDIAGKGRHMTQLDPIIKSERDLEMLIALSLADVQALRWDWHAELVAKLPEIRAHVRANLASGASKDEE